jgi:hypothetical protein
MDDLHDALTGAIDEAAKARARLAKQRMRQVQSRDERQYLQALAYAWFRSRRPVVLQHATATTDLSDIDAAYRIILDSSDKSARRTTYLDALQAAREHLMSLRSQLIVATPAQRTDETPPDFSPLAADPTMRDILVRRWQESQRCLRAGAPLAATVMMGGLLEALFVARANKLVDKSPLFRAKAAPLDSRTKKALDLKEWTLRPYIDVGHELGWISRSGKDVAAVLRDYRNYVHPEKERTHGVALTERDSEMFWELTKSLARQLLAVQIGTTQP